MLKSHNVTSQGEGSRTRDVALCTSAMYLLAAERKEDNIWTCSNRPRESRWFPAGWHCAMSATWLQRGSVSLLMKCSNQAAASLRVGRAFRHTLGPLFICRTICSRHSVSLPVAYTARSNLPALRSTTSGAPPPCVKHSRRLGSDRSPNFFEKVSGLHMHSTTR